MNEQVFLRPLKVDDAAISFKWRNDIEVWKNTGNKPDIYITKEIEKEWLETALRKENETRYAICLKHNRQYIGNVQLTNMTCDKAQFHIFIGEKGYWGKGIGYEATMEMLKLAKDKYELSYVYLEVKNDHAAAIRIYDKCGFYVVDSYDDKLLMEVKISND